MHVPFPEHKLTSVLIDVLSGDHTVPCSVILTVSPSPTLSQTELTLKTLRFGDSVKKYGGHRYSTQHAHVRQGHWTEGFQKYVLAFRGPAKAP